jgi:general stress protein 26
MVDLIRQVVYSEGGSAPIMDICEAKQLAQELVEKSGVVHLTTVGIDGFPRTRAMLNLRSVEMFPALVAFFREQPDDWSIYFSTNKSSRKTAQINADPRACAYFCRPENWSGLLLAGTIATITDIELKTRLWQPDWNKYYIGGVDGEDYTVLRLTPHFAEFYYQLEKAQWEFTARS